MNTLRQTEDDVTDLYEKVCAEYDRALEALGKL